MTYSEHFSPVRGIAISRLRKRIHIGLAVFWSVVMAWLFLNMQARDIDPSVLQSGPSVRVSTSSAALAFTPTTDTVGVGLLFYPGALADPEAYAPMARAVAEAGYEVVILELPFRLAPFEHHREQLARRTRAFIRGEGERREWIIGGHSKGGKLAAQFARDHATDIVGLLLVGTSHPREDDLSGLTLDVTKVYGSADGLASEEEVNRSGRTCLERHTGPASKAATTPSSDGMGGSPAPLSRILLGH